MTASIEELALEVTRGALTQQDERLGELRTRTATLLAAATIAGSFLGAQVLRSGHLNLGAIVALVAYTVCMGCCLYVLLRHEVELEFRGSALLSATESVRAEAKAQGVEVTEEDLRKDAHVALNRWIETSLGQNEGVLAHLGDFYSAAVVALGAEVAAWVISIVV